MDEPFRVYQTKKEWEHTARVFLTFGLVCGLVIGVGIAILLVLLIS